MKLLLSPALQISLILPMLGLIAQAADQDSNHPVATQGVPPAISWNELSAKATRQGWGEGLSITPTPEGAALHCAFQKLDAVVTENGLRLTSTADNGMQETFSVTASRLGRVNGDSHPLPATGKVILVGTESVHWFRPGILEEYSVSVDGVRQDFVIPTRPPGQGSLRVTLSVAGATVSPSADGVSMSLDASKRKLAYHRLQVIDNAGRPLPAEMTPQSDQSLAITVDDHRASYPLRIDPTFTDADWISVGGIPGANGSVNAVAADANGNVYVGGEFTATGPVMASYVAVWNGTAWSSLGTGVNGFVQALAVSGSSLYVGGYFTTAGGLPASGIARWDITSGTWNALGNGVNSDVYAITISGTSVFVGGNFTSAGGNAAAYVARWDVQSQTWNALGSGLNNPVRALATAGSDLYAGGFFTTAGGISANRVARWNGTAWSALGTGTNDTVRNLIMSGSTLYVGGDFTSVNGTTGRNRIAAWNTGSGTWSGLGTGLSSSVYALAVVGTDLFAGGTFTTAGGDTALRLAKWNGSAWSAVSQSGLTGGVQSLCNAGGQLIVGGAFVSTATSATRLLKIGKYDPASNTWTQLGSGFDHEIRTMAVLASDLYAGGYFQKAGSVTARGIAKWNGSSWSALGTGLNGNVEAMEVSGGTLYVGGGFSTAGGLTVNGVAVWNGSSWSALGTGLGGGTVTALRIFSGTLYAGGGFSGGLFKFNGANSTWAVVSSGISGGTTPGVKCLAVFGSELYVGGRFTNAGGTSGRNNLARFNGTSWASVGTGVNGEVRAFGVSTSSLFVGGDFTTAGGQSGRSYIAAWDGTNWQSVGTGMNDAVSALAMDGTVLYAGGWFTTAGSVSVNKIAKWDGIAWSALGSGLSGGFDASGQVNTLLLSGTELWVGGDFSVAGNKAAGFLAKANLAGGSSPAPTPANIRAVQVPGTHRVEVFYDMTDGTGGTAGSSDVSVQVSLDNGATWPHTIAPAAAQSPSAIGAAVPWGVGKKITWNAGGNWPAGQPKFSKQVKFRITAGTAPNTATATSYQTMVDVENPDIEALVKVVDDAIPGLNEEENNWNTSQLTNPLFQLTPEAQERLMTLERNKRGVFFSNGPIWVGAPGVPGAPSHYWKHNVLLRHNWLQGWTVQEASDTATDNRLFFWNQARYQTVPTAAWAYSPIPNIQSFEFPLASEADYRNSLNNPTADFTKTTEIYKRLELPRVGTDFDKPSDNSLPDWKNLSRQLDPSAKKLVIVLHGWNRTNEVDPYGGDGFRDLLKGIHNRLQQGAVLGVNDWDLYAYDWASDASTGNVSGNFLDGPWSFDTHASGGVGVGQENGKQAAEIAYQHGLVLGKLLWEKYGGNLEKVHFIAHSAGTWAARSGSLYLRAKIGAGLVQQVTLLDPYNPQLGKDEWSPFPGGEHSVLDTSDINSWPDATGGFRFENIYSDDTAVKGTNGTYWGGQSSAILNGVTVANQKVGSSVFGVDDSGAWDGTAWNGHGGPVRFYAFSADDDSESTSWNLIGAARDPFARLEQWIGSDTFTSNVGWDLGLHHQEVIAKFPTVRPTFAYVWGSQFRIPSGTVVPPPAMAHEGNLPPAPAPSGWAQILVDVSDQGWARLLFVPFSGQAGSIAGPARIHPDGTFTTKLDDGSAIAGQFDLVGTNPELHLTVNGNAISQAGQIVTGGSAYAGRAGTVTNGGTLSLMIVMPDGTAGVHAQGIDISGGTWSAYGTGTVDSGGQLAATDGNGFQLQASLTANSPEIPQQPVISPPAGIVTTVIDAASKNMSSAGGVFDIQVISNGPWTVVENATWITATASAASGNGSVAVVVAANAGVSPRQALITIGGQIHVVNQAGQSVALPSPLLHLPLDGNANDASGNGHLPTSSGLTYGADRNGGTNGAAYFGNTSSTGTTGISVSNAPALNPASYTLATWIKPTSNGYNSQQDWAVIVRKGIQFRYGLFTNINNRTPSGGFYPGTGVSQISGASGLNLNQWHHLALSYSSTSGGTVKLYVDGQPANQSTGTGSLPSASTAPISIGSGNFSAIASAFQGWMDDIRLYGEALTDQQVQQLYNGGASNGLLTSWRQQFFGSSSGNGNGADSADYEGDGVPNLVEFYQGTSPNVRNGETPLNQLARQSGGQVTFRYRRSKTALGVGGQVLWSPDLVNWAGNGGTSGGTRVVFTEQVLDDQPEYQVIQVTGTASPSLNQKLFLRLAVTVIP